MSGRQMQTIKRVQTPDDLAGTLASVVSEDAAFVTGKTFYADAGLVRVSLTARSFPGEEVPCH